MPELPVAALALLLGGGAVLALHHAVSQRESWLIITLVAALAFVLVSMSVAARSHADATWFQLVRWSLFVATLGAFVRFRWHHRFTAKPPDSSGDIR